MVCVLKHNHHLILAERQRELVCCCEFLHGAKPCLALAVIALTLPSRNSSMMVTLCNTLARGLIINWIPTQTIEKTKKSARPTIAHPPLESAALSEIRAALEVPPPRSPGVWPWASLMPGHREPGGRPEGGWLKVAS